MLLGELANAFGHSGELTKGQAAIDEALIRSERYEERWCVAELLRIKGELLLNEEKHGPAEVCLQQSLDWARRQGALSCELRTAMSLARLLRDQRRSMEGIDLLSAVFGKFTEGFETRDLKAAKALLAH
jgi:predicted ATPase